MNHLSDWQKLNCDGWFYGGDSEWEGGQGLSHTAVKGCGWG